MNYKLIEINNITFDVEPTMDFYVPTIWTNEKNRAELETAIRSWIVEVLRINYTAHEVLDVPDKLTVIHFKQKFDIQLANDLLGDWAVDSDDMVMPMSTIKYKIEYPTEVYALVPLADAQHNLAAAASDWINEYLQIKLEEVR